MSSRNYQFSDDRGFKSYKNQYNDYLYASTLDQSSKAIGNWKMKNYNSKEDNSELHTQKPSKNSQLSFLRKTIDYPGANCEPTYFQTIKNHQPNKLRNTYHPRDQPYIFEKSEWSYQKYPIEQKQKESNFLSRIEAQKSKKLKSYTGLHQNDKLINEQESQYFSINGVNSPRSRARTQGQSSIKQQGKNFFLNRANYQDKNSEYNKYDDMTKFTKKKVNFQCYTPKIEYLHEVPLAKTYSNTATPFTSKYQDFQNDKNETKQIFQKNIQTVRKNEIQEKDICSPTTARTSVTKRLKFSSQKAQKQISFQDFYLAEKLGQGRYGNVYKAFHKTTGAIFALKKLKKDQIKQHNLILQIKMQLMFNHPNNLKLYGFFHDAEYLYLILQYMPSKTLFNYLKQKGKLEQKDASDKMRQILQGVHYLHQNNIAHRDIKPQNIVMCDDICKLCDFGASAVFTNRRNTIVGTPDYACPEVLLGEQYGIQIDNWCIGVLCYELLIGKAPFYHRKVKQTFKKIMNVDTTQLVFPETISDQAVDFISNLLVKNSHDRMSTEEALQHPFITMYMDEQDHV